MEELFQKLEALSEDKQLTVLTSWLDGIDKAGEYGGVGAGMTEAAKNELMMGDYDDFHAYARKNGGEQESVKSVIEYVKEEDEDECEDLISELNEILEENK